MCACTHTHTPETSTSIHYRRGSLPYCPSVQHPYSPNTGLSTP